MSRKVAHSEIITAAEAARVAWATQPGGWPVVMDTDNRSLIDFSTQVNPYVSLDIVYTDGKQMDMGLQPWVGHYGYVALAVCIAEGKGTSKANLLMDFMSSRLQLKTLPLVQLEVARPQASVTRMGWFCLVTMINFSYHELS